MKNLLLIAITITSFSLQAGLKETFAIPQSSPNFIGYDAGTISNDTTLSVPLPTNSPTIAEFLTFTPSAGISTNQQIGLALVNCANPHLICSTGQDTLTSGYALYTLKTGYMTTLNNVAKAYPTNPQGFVQYGKVATSGPCWVFTAQFGETSDKAIDLTITPEGTTKVIVGGNPVSLATGCLTDKCGATTTQKALEKEKVLRHHRRHR